MKPPDLWTDENRFKLGVLCLQAEELAKSMLNLKAAELYYYEETPEEKPRSQVIEELKRKAESELCDLNNIINDICKSNSPK